jgi:DHA3 family macrolide efflux protein-like MFS transporter
MLDDAQKEPLARTPSLAHTIQEQPVNFLTLLRNANFRNLFGGQLISQVGDYFAFLGIAVVVATTLARTDAEATAAVSVVMIAIALPRLVFGILAGVFVDRWDRRRTMLGSDLIRPGLTLAMIPALLSHNLGLVCGVAFLLSAVGTFFIPAKGAIIPSMVPTEHLTAANALIQTSSTLGFFIGPGLAGATFALLGAGNAWIAFVVDALSFLVSALAIWRIKLPPAATQAGPRTAEEGRAAAAGSALGRVGQELQVGLRALLLNRTIFILALVFGLTMLGIGALNVLWVVFLKSAYGYGATELGWRFALVDAAFFAGMVLASVGVGNFMTHQAPKRFIVWGLILGGVAIVPVGFAPDYWLVVGAWFLVGLAVAPMETGVTTLMQIVVPNSQLGRVGGGIGTVSETASITSMALAGVLGALLGIPTVIAIAGILCILAGLLAQVGLPGLTLQDQATAQPNVPDETDAPARRMA